MNKRLETAIKALNLDPSKTQLIVCNHQVVSKHDAVEIFKQLSKYGHKEATIVMVDGDVREAIDVHELPLPEDLK